MAVDASSFVADLPEFADATKYPPASITYWLNAASQLMNQNRWGAPAVAGQPNSLYDLGQEMYVAHQLTLEARAQAVAANGGVPGESAGMVSAKSVDGVSKSYDTASAAEQNAGYFNLTVYGQRFWRLAEQVGMGGLQLGIGQAPPFATGAWAGPYPYPSSSGFSS